MFFMMTELLQSFLVLIEFSPYFLCDGNMEIYVGCVIARLSRSPFIRAPQIHVLLFAVSPVFLHHPVDNLKVFRRDPG
jgi:hypothetical protein